MYKALAYHSEGLSLGLQFRWEKRKRSGGKEMAAFTPGLGFLSVSLVTPAQI